MKLVDIPVENIKIGKRYREASGDTSALARDIKANGLLQPIGITADYTLIFGYRRLQACMDLLNWKTMPCVILNLPSILQGEYSENEMRKAFTPSERAAIARAIETDLLAKQRKPGPKSSANADDPVARSVDIAAKKSGFRSAETYQRAQKVVALGAPETVAAMDSGDMSISAAAAIVSQPKEDQVRIVNMPKPDRQKEIQQIRKAQADKASDEARARDLRIFRALHDHVEFIANFTENSGETWAGLLRVSAYSFSDNLTRAIQCLTRLQKEHPNEPWKPQVVKSR